MTWVKYRDKIQMADGLAPTTIHIESEEDWYIIKNLKASIYLQGTTQIVPTTYKKNMLSLPLLSKLFDSQGAHWIAYNR